MGFIQQNQTVPDDSGGAFLHAPEFLVPILDSGEIELWIRQSMQYKVVSITSALLIPISSIDILGSHVSENQSIRL